MRTLALILVLAISQACLAQRSSVARLETPVGIGTCVVVKLETKSGEGWVGLVASAWHVISDGNGGRLDKVRVKYENGQTCSSGYFVDGGEECDIAILRVWIPDSAPALEISDVSGPRDLAEIYGYPYGEYASATGPLLRQVNNWQICNIECRPGYSGGAMTVDGKLVGIIQGGWFMIRGEDERPTAWPTKCASASQIRKFIQRSSPTSD